MDIKAMARRGMRSGMPRTIGCLLLLLIILWHFDGALRESTDVQRVVNNLSAYVSNVAISKDVVVLDHKEQKTSVRRFNIVKFHLICWRESVSLFPRPICRGWGPEVLSASNDDVTYNVSQIGINSKNELPTTHPWGYGRGEPIVLVLVTQYGGTNFFTGYARMGRWLASYSGQSEARKNGPDIGAELAMLYVNGSEPLFTGEDGRKSGGNKGQGNPHRSNPIVQITMLGFGAGCSGLGFWQMFSARRDQFGPLKVVALLVVGWCLLVAGGIWLPV
jgi:hypothetical protein